MSLAAFGLTAALVLGIVALSLLSAVRAGAGAVAIAGSLYAATDPATVYVPIAVAMIASVVGPLMLQRAARRVTAAELALTQAQARAQAPAPPAREAELEAENAALRAEVDVLRGLVADAIRRGGPPDEAPAATA